MAAGVGEGAVGFPVGFLALEGLAFVVLALAFAEAEQDFGVALREVDFQRNQHRALGVELPGEAVNFLLVEQQPAGAERINIPAVGLLVGRDVGVVEPALAALDFAESLINRSARSPEAFDLGAFQLDAGFERFADEIIAPGFVVLDGWRHVGGSIAAKKFRGYNETRLC